MLFAVQLWCDIRAHPSLQKEAFLTENQGVKIQNVSIDRFILGFEHWLRHHEEKQLLEYIHPFRFMRTFFSRDSPLSDGSHPAEKPILDAEEIKDLVARVKAKSSAFPPSARFVVFPASMPGSKIPWPTGMLPFIHPSATEMALINFDNIYSCGLPSYECTYRKFIRIAMPKVIADERFSGKAFHLKEADIRLLRDPTSPGPISLFGVNTVVGPIWQAPKLPQRAIGPPVDEYETMPGQWELSVQHHTPFWVTREARSKMKTALDKMVSSGDIEIRSGLRLDIDNSLVPFLRKSLEGEDSPGSTLAPVPQSAKVPRMSLVRLAELLIPLQNTGRLLSVGWREARNKLRDMDVGGLDEANRTVVRVLDIIREAREQTKMELKGLNDLVESLRNNPEFVTQPFFLGTVAQRICRMIGVDASTEWDESAWSKHLKVKLLDYHTAIGEKTGKVLLEARKAVRYPGQAEDRGTNACGLLQDLLSTRGFEDQEDILEAEYQLLVHQVDELSR
ncbi:hypothetical protein N0V84_010373 [Fusarium piperis]|uniref:Uncharacterized protein n=1 Tax=Fusarium piperis TaxID=1435070 RepID=A0A9W8TFL1_9HYPO|nr:hypothetical protein N0V84_010373 [Fusarium piperis]